MYHKQEIDDFPIYDPEEKKKKKGDETFPVLSQTNHAVISKGIVITSFQLTN